LGYGSATLVAEKYTDVCSIGSKNGPTVENYLFWPFIEQTGLALDGIMGLGPEESALYYQAYSAGAIEAPLFAIALGKTTQ